MSIYTTEITSDNISSDNPIHQRLLMPYMEIRGDVYGEVLEIGCGEGRGVELLIGRSTGFTAVDKISEVIERLSAQHPGGRFLQMNLPPLAGLKDNSYDTVISFQVIEHIRNDRLYLEEIRRVLKPGGKAYITTPNIKMTLTRNPWHIREYTPSQLRELAESVFNKVRLMGIAGNDKVMEYYEQNKVSVRRIMKWDILNLQYRLPAALLRIPYDLMNRLNRKKLEKGATGLVAEIRYSDYILSKDPEGALDLFLVIEK